MNLLTLQQTLQDWDRRGRYVFSRHGLRRLFAEESTKAFEKSLTRMVTQGVLKRATRGVYVNPNALSFDGYVIEHIAKARWPQSSPYRYGVAAGGDAA